MPGESQVVCRQMAVVAVGTALMVPGLAAQDRPPQEQEVVIPASAMPPEGMCRVWLRNVPERQQPAPTDCVTAIRTRPRDGILLLGNPTPNAKLPPKRATTYAQPPRGGLWDDPLVRRGAGVTPNVAQRTQVQRGASGGAQPSPSTRLTGPQPAGAAAASVKPAEQPKAAVVRPPDPPEQRDQPRH